MRARRPQNGPLVLPAYQHPLANLRPLFHVGIHAPWEEPCRTFRAAFTVTRDENSALVRQARNAAKQFVARKNDGRIPRMKKSPIIQSSNHRFVFPETHFYSIDPRLGYPIDVFAAELPVVLEHTTASHVITDADGVLLLIACGVFSDSVCYSDGRFREASVSEVCGHFRIQPDGRLGYISHYDWNSPPLPADQREWVRTWWYGLAEIEQSRFAMRMRHPGFPTEDLIKVVGGLESESPALEGVLG